MQPVEPSSGILIVVVGPSGAGKDTIMAIAAEHFGDDPRVHFVRRSITRPVDAGGEDHLALDEDAFQRQEALGRFAVSWQAHGLSYGVPCETLEQLKTKACLVVNGSRSALALFQKAFPRLVVVEITARPQILAARLAKRGRETETEILARLEHRPVRSAMSCQTWTIDNSSTSETAGMAFIDIIERCLQTA